MKEHSRFGTIVLAGIFLLFFSMIFPFGEVLDAGATRQQTRKSVFKNAKTWMYQLQDLDQPGAVAALAGTEYAVLVLEPGHNLKDSPYDTASIVNALKTMSNGAQRILLAYINIGEAEDYRDYWGSDWIAPTETQRGYPDFLITTDPDGWSGNYPVAYWRNEWKEIWLGDEGIVAELARYGFDGVYLDWVEAYDDDRVRAAAAEDGVNPEKEMIRFIEQIGQTGRSISEGFLVIVQNAPYLIDTDPDRYAAAIDGLAVEGTWFYGEADADWDDPRAGDIRNNHPGRWSTASLLKQYKKYADRNLPIFSVDYCIEKENIVFVYSQARAAGLKPLVTRVSLSRLTESPPPPQNKWEIWSLGTHLRGANIYQRRVYPELDGPILLGNGPVGPPYTQEDFNRLAAMGANVVNISHPGLFTETPPYTVDYDIQNNLDRLIEMIAAADLFAVISFRTGPGRSEFTFFWDEVGDLFDASYLNDSVWQDQAAQDAWVEMWRYAAARYRNVKIVVGYDLMVEPNSNEVGSDALQDNLDIWDPEEFYDLYGGTLYDWNQLYPRIHAAIREVDRTTPILTGGNGYSAAEWLPYVQPTGEQRTVYCFHQYEPYLYTHQEPNLNECRYPGLCDTDWNGIKEWFGRLWIEDLLSTVDGFMETYHTPVTVNEFGVMRWEQGAAEFMDDQMDLFERRGLNHALWVWESSWQPWEREVDEFNFRHGPDPNNHVDVDSSDLLSIIESYWKKNIIRPSTTDFSEDYRHKIPWRRMSDGLVALWTLDANDTRIGYRIYGPYNGWSAESYE